MNPANSCWLDYKEGFRSVLTQQLLEDVISYFYTGQFYWVYVPGSTDIQSDILQQPSLSDYFVSVVCVRVWVWVWTEKTNCLLFNVFDVHSITKK